MRKIPATMASQHPDNALAPYWDEKLSPFIGAYQEINEAYHCFKDLDVSEYMWDWEGKHADAGVIDRMFSDYHEYFSKNQLGRDKFLTFRIPNIWEEKGYNLMLAMVAILAAEDFARDLRLFSRPLFEVILPMTTRPEQLMRIHTLFEKLAKFKNTDFTKKEADDNEYIELIPLFESLKSQLGVKELLEKYTGLHQAHYGQKPEYLRPFLACSDAALTSGFLAGIIGNKVALTRLYEFSDQSQIDVFPMAGPGSLVFRGGLSPGTIDRFISELPGLRTVTVQSSFRYDNLPDKVKSAIAELEAKLPKSKPRMIAGGEQSTLIKIAEISEKSYQESLAKIAVDMQPIWKAVPKRRDRRQHIGLLAYSRQIGETKMPRAITFTGGFYSVGVPPEFIGLGLTLNSLGDAQLGVLNDNYSSLKGSLERAGRFLNKSNLEILARRNKAWQSVADDIKSCEKIFNVDFEPLTGDEKAHQEISSKVINSKDNEDLRRLINQGADLRKSLG